MIIRRFLLWYRAASPSERAEAVGALARAYLSADLSDEVRREAELALTNVLDDGAPVVRLALAEAMGGAAGAPRTIIVALASDQSDIAALVLSRSPVLTDADLVDCAASGDGLAQSAIAIRPHLASSVAAALAEVAGPDALAALARNHAAVIPAFSLRRMVERHGEDAGLREALIARADLPADIRHAIATAVAATLSRFVVGCRWMTAERIERASRESGERTAIALAGHEPEAVASLVSHLRRCGQLTPTLLLRAVFSGHLALVEEALAELSGLPGHRVAALLQRPGGPGFAALCRKAGLSARLERAFSLAIAAWHEDGRNGPSARLSRRMIERVLTACEGMPDEESGPLMSLLARFAAEAAREEARELSAALAPTIDDGQARDDSARSVGLAVAA
jgi:uncharacterized protein (DUF2336 family)